MATAVPTIAELLEAAGYGYRRTERSYDTGKREIFRIEDGVVVGEMTGKEALEFIGQPDAEHA